MNLLRSFALLVLAGATGYVGLWLSSWAYPGFAAPFLFVSALSLLAGVWGAARAIRAACAFGDTAGDAHSQSEGQA